MRRWLLSPRPALSFIARYGGSVNRKTGARPAAPPRKAPVKARASGSPSPRAAEAKAAAAAAPAQGAATGARDALVAERDARLAIRQLMTLHHTRVTRDAVAPQQEAARMREHYQDHHQWRDDRIEQKTLRSAALLRSTADGGALGDGVIPLKSRHPGPSGGVWQSARTSDEHAALEHSEDGEDEGEVEEWQPASLQALARPNLAVYSPENDVRVRSKDASGEEEEGDEGSRAAALLRRELMLEDEDPEAADENLTAYFSGSNREEGETDS